MALTQDREPKIRKLQAGDGHQIEVSGIASFTTTDASGELFLPNLSVLEAISLVAVGAPASDEVISLDEAALVAGGVIPMPTDGKVTITRTGAVKTNALKFSYIAKGY